MTCKQAATRLRSDASTVGKYIRRGLGSRWKAGRLYLKAVKRPHGYEITADAVRTFSTQRRERGF